MSQSPRTLASAALSQLNSDITILPYSPSSQHTPAFRIGEGSITCDPHSTKSQDRYNRQACATISSLDPPPLTPDPNQPLKHKDEKPIKYDYGAREELLISDAPSTSPGKQSKMDAHNEAVTAVNGYRPPSLLRYVDKDLISNGSRHNYPPSSDLICRMCNKKHNACPQRSTYLPLVPCGCWIHYRCFINWTASTMKSEISRSSCPMCSIKLFQWEGVTALTLSIRTGLLMQGLSFNPPKYVVDPLLLHGSLVHSAAEEYELDCNLIWRIIEEKFFASLVGPDKFASDASPNLMLCFHNVMAELERVGLPRAEWLQYKTMTGYYSFSTLVAVKMRRYLVEHQPGIQKTEAWQDFEDGRMSLGQKLINEKWNVEGEAWVV